MFDSQGFAIYKPVAVSPKAAGSPYLTQANTDYIGYINAGYDPEEAEFLATADDNSRRGASND